MHFVIATLLVVISMGNAEPSRFGQSSRQTAPYKSNNLKPQGAPFTLPQRQQEQPSYNTPSSQKPSTKYGVPESNKQRESLEVDDLKDSTSQNEPARLQKNERQMEESSGTYYLLLPQTQLFTVQQPLYTAKIQEFQPTATLYQPFYKYVF